MLLQASAGGNYHGAIQLTNPRARAQPADKVRPEEALASQKLGHRARAGDRGRGARGARPDRELRGGRREGRGRRSSSPPTPPTSSRSAAGPAAERGLQLPIALARDRVTFRYDGLDGRRRPTHVAFRERADTVEAVEPDVAGPSTPAGSGSPGTGRSPRATRRELRWLTWSVERAADDEGRQAATPPTPTTRLFPPEPVLAADEVAASYHAWNRSVSEIRTDNELVNLAINRSTSDLRLLVNDGPGEGERYLAAGVPWFTTAVRPRRAHRLVPGAVRPAAGRGRDPRGPRLAPGRPSEDPERDAEPGKILHELRTGEMARTGELPHRRTTARSTRRRCG